MTTNERKEEANYKSHHKNGQLKEIGNLINDKKEGTWKTYYDNGQLANEVSYKKNKKEGLFKEYWLNGHLMREENYKNDKKEGDSKDYFNNGQLKFELGWLNDEKEGNWKLYHKNGQLHQQGFFKKGKENGLFKTYHQNGKLEWEGELKDGGFVGNYKRFYEEGTLQLDANYKNGKLDGIIKTYHPNGELGKEINYKNGEIQKEESEKTITAKTTGCLSDIGSLDDIIKHLEKNPNIIIHLLLENYWSGFMQVKNPSDAKEINYYEVLTEEQVEDIDPEYGEFGNFDESKKTYEGTFYIWYYGRVNNENFLNKLKEFASAGNSDFSDFDGYCYDIMGMDADPDEGQWAAEFGCEYVDQGVGSEIGKNNISWGTTDYKKSEYASFEIIEE